MRLPTPTTDRARGAKGETTMLQIENAQKFGKENVDAALKSFGAVSKGAQALAVEVADYAKKSFEDGAAVFEKLLGAKTVENAIRIQSDYVTAAYEGFVAPVEEGRR